MTENLLRIPQATTQQARMTKCFMTQLAHEQESDFKHKPSWTLCQRSRGKRGRHEKCDWATIQGFKGHILDTIYLAIFFPFDPANNMTQNNDSADNNVSPACR